MRLSIVHTTRYRFDRPVDYALQELRLMPRSGPGQEVLSWNIELAGGRRQVDFADQHGNHVVLVRANTGVEALEIHCRGEVETSDTHGIFGRHQGPAPLWYITRSTALTRQGPQVRALARKLAAIEDTDIARLHALRDLVADAVTWETGRTHAETSAEDALTAGHGVCQDQAHVFLAAARAAGYPGRYVSGYLMLDDRIEQDASHAWAEVHVEDLGWVGFDVSNGIAPDERYVRIATGLDYREAAPVSGLRFGEAAEDMSVTLQVQQ